ncbi:Lsr2 family DNA-binding protein [Streptomyces sp. NPDC001809]
MTASVDLAALTALCPPPAVVPAAPDWSLAERELGVRLPTDYKELVAAYGPGEFCDFLTLYQPGALSGWVDLTGPMPARLRTQLDAVREAGGRRADGPPCATGELLAMGVTGSGAYLFWVTRPREDPDRWPIVVSDRLGAPWFTYRGSVTGLLVEVLGGTLRVPLFPGDLLSAGPSFTASRLRDRVPVTEPDDRPPVATGCVRAWARANGYEVPDRGRVPLAILEAWETATRPR